MADVIAVFDFCQRLVKLRLSNNLPLLYLLSPNKRSPLARPRTCGDAMDAWRMFCAPLIDQGRPIVVAINSPWSWQLPGKPRHGWPLGQLIASPRFPMARTASSCPAVGSTTLIRRFPASAGTGLARQAMRQRLGRGNGAASCALAASKA
jgi:hypothetical protein